MGKLRAVSWSAVLVVSAAVAVTVLCGYLLATWPPEPPPAPRSAAARPAATRVTPADSASSTPSPVSQQAPLLAVLGDSFSAKNEASTGAEWPQLLGDAMKWQVVTEAGDGNGYLSAGESGPFRREVRALLGRRPDTIIVAGGYNDIRSYGVSQVTRAADRLVRRLVAKAPDAQVVVVSPFSDGDPGPLALQLSESLRQVAKRHDVEYVDATSWLTGGDLMATDGVHPTDQGQRQIAMRMEQALKGLGAVGRPPVPPQ